VMAEAQRMADAGASGSAAATPGKADPKAPFSNSELERYILENAASVRSAGAGFEAVADSLLQIAAEFATAPPELESLEQRLTALEQKMIAIARARQSDEEALEARKSLDQQLKPYRGKMTAAQIVMLEQQFLERNVLEALGLPRLSMFYLR